MAEDQELRTALGQVARTYQQIFTKQSGGATALARGYAVSRGILAHGADHFGLGFAPAQSDKVPLVAKLGLDRELLLEGGVLENRDGRLVDPMEGRLIFPLTNSVGDVVGFTGRSIVGGGPEKYVNTSRTAIFRKTETLFRIDRARQAIAAEGVAIVVEGPLDAVLMWQAGYRNVVSVGTASLSEAQAQILARWAKRVQVAFDHDEAGDVGFSEAIRKRSGWFTVERFSYPAKYNDPAEYVQAFIRR